MRFRLYFASLVCWLSIAGCTRPSVLVCREVTTSGTCRLPTTELEVGREYALFVTGVGMPHGAVKMRVYWRRNGNDERIAEATRFVADDATFFTSPLTLIHRGNYRLEVVDAEGDVWKAVRVDAPQSIFTLPTMAPAMNR
jgi:hypothetical protein